MVLVGVIMGLTFIINVLAMSLPDASVRKYLSKELSDTLNIYLVRKGVTSN